MLRLVPAKYEDWELLLSWRNDRITRENSIITEILDPDSHKKWLLASVEDINRNIYIVEKDEQPSGVVRSDRKSWGYEISWTVAPAYRGKGYGKQMVKLLVDSLSGKIIAKVKEDNIASIKVAKYAGLKFDKKDGNILIYILEK